MDELIRQVAKLARKLSWFGVGIAVYVGYSEYERYILETRVRMLEERVKKIEGV